MPTVQTYSVLIISINTSINLIPQTPVYKHVLRHFYNDFGIAACNNKSESEQFSCFLIGR